MKRFIQTLSTFALIAGLALVGALLNRQNIESGGADNIATDTLKLRVVDGDSLEIGTERIRLWGIDAPELDQSCTDKAGKTNACGRIASAHLRRLISGAPVLCKGLERDRYDRLLAICSVGQIELNKAMVQDGHALAFGGYDADERVAKNAKIGLWAGTFERPQDHRRKASLLGDNAEGTFTRFFVWLIR